MEKYRDVMMFVCGLIVGVGLTILVRGVPLKAKSVFVPIVRERQKTVEESAQESAEMHWRVQEMFRRSDQVSKRADEIICAKEPFLPRCSKLSR